MKERAKFDYDALVKADRVHSSLYTEPEIFSDEMDRIFHRGWVYVGHAGEVPNPGDFRLKRIGMVPVIMVRGQDGKVNLLLNRCRHRGAMVCHREQGNLRAFKCAYHGWTYRLDGSLSGVPYPEAYEGTGFRREEMGLVKVARVGEHRGFIFGSLSPAGVTLEEHLGRAARELDMFVGLSDSDDIEVVSGINKYDFQGNWKLAIENSMDGYHPGVVHASFVDALIEKIKNNPSPEHKVDFDPASFIAGGGISRDLGGGHVMLDYGFRMYDPLNKDPLPPVRATTPEGEARLGELERMAGKERAADMLREGGTHTFIFPNLILIGLQMRVVQPVSVNYSSVCLYPTLIKWLAPEVNAIRLRSHEAFFGSASFGGPDDSEIFERVQMGCAADLEPWQIISRGMNREKRDQEGLIYGDITDEVTQRAIWRQYKKVMMQQAGAGASRKRSPRAAGERG